MCCKLNITVYSVSGRPLCEKIEKQMILKKLNQNQLAKKMGIRNGTLSDFKKRRIKKPSFELMKKIADALDVSLDEFR